MPPEDWANNPDAREWLEHAQRELPDKLRGSAIVCSLVPEEPDAKYAVELGMSLMLDKPIVLVVPPGRRVPERLVRVADLIIDADIGTEAGRQSMQTSLVEFIQKFEDSS